MSFTRNGLAIALLAVMTAFLFSTQPAMAGSKEYVPEVKSATLVDGPLPGVDGKTVIIKRFEFPPGYVGGRHMHPGPVFVYVVRGQLTLDYDQSGRRAIEAGELLQEPIGETMQARNVSATEPTEIVVFQVGDVGKPMMIKKE